MRLIDADELRKAFKKHPLCNDVWLKYSRELIDNAPTVEPNQLTQDIIDKVNVNIGLAQPIKDVRPQGEWIRTGSLGNGNAHYECSKCHYGDEHAESQEVPYCWHCGASMIRGDKNEF